MTNQITLNSLVRNECCNLVQDSCLGVNLSGKRFRNEGVCWIFQKKPCKYFTDCVQMHYKFETGC